MSDAPQQETIAAVATAAGEAGIGIVRLSGQGAHAIASTLLGKPPTPRFAHFSKFNNADDALIDEGLLLYFPAPHSFTGEDVVEIQIHGSRITLDLMLKRVRQLGARLARAGEFSERAFLNGKMDLVQAEAIADLIAAQSELAARSALRSLQGVFSAKVDAVLAGLIALRVHIEAAIDFPEEEIDFLSDPAIANQFVELQVLMQQLSDEARRGVRLAHGLSVVIVGRPNAGKSSLLNQLAGSERAIVTDIAGTTRDALRETLDMDGISMELVDTAGLRDSEDTIEQEGVRRAKQHLRAADLALLVSDDQHCEADLALLDGLPASSQRIIIINKIDLDAGYAHEEIRGEDYWLWLSAKTGQGVDALRTVLKRLAGADGGANSTFSARQRHVEALSQADCHVNKAAEVLKATRAGELAAEELRQAQQYLSEITGEYYPDDLLGAIFSSFCIGK